QNGSQRRTTKPIDKGSPEGSRHGLRAFWRDRRRQWIRGFLHRIRPRRGDFGRRSGVRQRFLRALKFRNVRAGRQFDPVSGMIAARGVKLQEAPPQIAGSYADDGIGAGIVGGPSAEKFYPERAFLEIVVMPVEGLLHYELQKFLAAFASLERRAL